MSEESSQKHDEVIQENSAAPPHEFVKKDLEEAEERSVKKKTRKKIVSSGKTLTKIKKIKRTKQTEVQPLALWEAHHLKILL